jgi:hypothetical protein
MTQLSRPYQIALVALALLVLVWFAALRGHTSSSGAGSGSSPAASSAPATPSASAQAKAAGAPTHVYHGAAPGVEGLTRAIDKAHGAVAQSQREARRVETAEPSAPSSSASSTAAPATDAAASHSTATHAAAGDAATRTATHAVTVHAHGSPPAAKHTAAAPNMQAPVEHELHQGKTVLILFWNSHGSEDVAVHDALPAVQRALGGRIAVHYATAKQVGVFGTITHAVQVTQTPTLLIVNPRGHTTVLTGLNDAFAIQQAVSEAHRS